MLKPLQYLNKKSTITGPTVWLTGVIHGDEPGGEVVINKLFAELEKVELLKGSLHAFPVINKSGLVKKVRHLPETGEDLNRLFPGRLGGTIGEAIASDVWQQIIKTKPDLVLDLHNDWLNSISYTLIDDRENMSPDFHARLGQIALVAGLVTVQENVKTFGQTLSGSLTKKSVPALTLELGGAQIIDEKNVKIGVNAILRVLCQLGLISQEIFSETLDVKDASTLSVKNKIFNYSDDPKPTTAGPIQILVKPGQMVEKGDLVARIGNSEKLFAREKAVVLGSTDETISQPGKEILAFGLES